VEPVTWVLTVISIIGVILNARQRIEGFYFWMIGNAGWVVVNVIAGIPAQAVLFGFYFLMCFYGVYTWRKKTRG
jgi:nicotinamide riboside transporter PnuC